MIRFSFLLRIQWMRFSEGTGLKRTNTPAHDAGVDEMAASRPGFQAQAWLLTTLERPARILTPVEISARAKQGNELATATLARHIDRLARGLAHVVNIIDPDVIVLGGGLSQLSHLYELLPHLMAPYIFADRGSAVIKPPKWGSASGVRGAARLWDLPAASFKRLGELG